MTESAEGIQEVPYDRVRRVTSRLMTASVTMKSQVTLHRHADVSALERGLERARSAEGADGLGFTPALLAAVARGLVASRINGTVADQVIALHHGVDLGVAVDVSGSLVVPVIRDAHRRSVASIGHELSRRVAAAAAGALRPGEVEGATFTVTSLGVLGVELFTPIINPPQLAILGVGAIGSHLGLTDGAVVSVRKVGLSLSFDHGATDGAAAARALDTLVRAIERPVGLPWTDVGPTSSQPPAVPAAV